MSSAVVANFDAMQALRILLKLEEAPDQDSSYLRHLVLADAKRNVFAAAGEPASEEACAEVEAADAAPEEAAAEADEATAEEMVADAEDAPEETAVDVEAEESAPEETKAEGETSDSAAEEESEAKAPPKKTSAKA